MWSAVVDLASADLSHFERLTFSALWLALFEWRTIMAMRFEHDVIISNQRMRIDRLARQRDRLRKALAVICDETMRGRSSCPYCEEDLEHRSECPFSPLSDTDE